MLLYKLYTDGIGADSENALQVRARIVKSSGYDFAQVLFHPENGQAQKACMEGVPVQNIDMRGMNRMESGRKTVRTSCECCGNYVYDEENDYYICEVNLDEDEMGRFLRGTVSACPYYQPDDEYRIVRRQM